jgi:hypothetical protein
MDYELGSAKPPELPGTLRPGTVPVPLAEVVLGIDDAMGVPDGDELTADARAPLDDETDDFDPADEIGIDATLVVETAEGTDADIDITERPEPTKIAGVTRVHISDALPHYPKIGRIGANPFPDYNTLLERRRTLAAEALAESGAGTEPLMRGKGDPRIPYVEVWGNPRDERIEYDKPTHTFLLNDSLMGKIHAAAVAKGSELTINELRDIGLAETEGAVRPDFTPDAMNDVNASYYASDVAFSPDAKLATLFTANRPINQALGAMMATESGATDTLKVKELCSGGRNGHWAFEAQGAIDAGVQHVDVTLTDFVTPNIEPEAAAAAGTTVRAEQYSLLDAMPPLPENERFDAMITTYGFDSVWQAGDMHISKDQGQTYQILSRAKVADWNPRRDELVEAMRQNKPLPNATAADYDGIYMERAMEPIDLKSHKYGKYIEDHPGSTVIVPGGLINRVVNAFDTQLKEDGVFISADVGDFGLIEGTSPQKRFVPESDMVSGIAARYRCDDYVLAKKILEGEYGLDVTLMSLEDLGGTYLPPGWKSKATGEERDGISKIRTNGVMIVKRRRAA